MRGMKKNLFLTLLAAAALWGPRGLSAQAPSVEAVLTPDTVMIGDHFLLRVEVEKDLLQVVDFPEYEGGKMGKEIEILAESAVDTVAREGRRITLRKEYLLTSFDEGYYGLGRFPVLYLDKNLADTLYSDSLYLTVNTFYIDTATMSIHDIKEPIRAPLRGGEFLGYLALALCLGQVLFGIVYILWRRSLESRRAPRKKTPPAVPPHILAIRSLEQLQQEKLWQNNRHKMYYTRLTDIIRGYIEGRYGIDAPEMTSDEITAALRGIGLESRSYEQISRLLTTADYVKFAKYVPSVEDNEMSFHDAWYFVEDTKIIAPEPAGPIGKEDRP